MMLIDEFDNPGAHWACIKALCAMTPAERLMKALELSDFVIGLFRQGLCEWYPDLDDEAFARLFRERLGL